MSDCIEACPYEVKTQDARSPGVIGAEEVIFRGSYDPMHYPKGKLKGSFIKNVDLLNGQLSVWRAFSPAGCTTEDIIRIVSQSGPNDNKLAAVHGATAKQIRSLMTAETKQRLFCVIDETDVDDQGGFHPAHAHIKICDKQRRELESASDENYIFAKEQLIFLLKGNTVKADL